MDAEQTRQDVIAEWTVNCFGLQESQSDQLKEALNELTKIHNPISGTLLEKWQTRLEELDRVTEVKLLSEVDVSKLTDGERAIFDEEFSDQQNLKWFREHEAQSLEREEISFTDFRSLRQAKPFDK